MIRIGFIAQQIRRFSSKQSLNGMKYLNVAEKNDAAKTIAGFLSNGSARRREGLSVYNKIYEFETTVRGHQAKMTMTSVSGHLLNYEFPNSYRGWKTCDPQQLFDAPISKGCPQDYEGIKKTLEREIRSCQGLIVWTDCDREGENIGFEVIEVCRAVKPNISVYRAKFSEITAVAARRALENLVQPDKRQSEAVDIRQELDLRIGAAFTRFQTLRFQRIFPSQIAEKLISYGSCQIPTLGFVAQRYKEAEEFVSEPFWKLKVSHTIEDLTVEFHWARNRLFDKEACEDYLMLCLADPIAKVDSVVTKPKNKWRPNPMDTVQLEKLGSRKLKINAKTVMSIAEKLYQQGYISYPRTETNCFSKEIDLRSLVQHHTPHPDWGQFASRVLEWGPNPRNGNKSDQAHPPIHPIKFSTGLSGDEQRVYELVVRHFLACVSKDATGSETVVNISIGGEKFTATGLCIYERNYLDVYPYEKWNAKQIHRYEIGSTFEPDEISMQEGATTAPPLLTEADLIALMEKHGIGTDATHAEHIHTVKERGYIGEVDRGFLVPGTIGMGLYEGYHAMELPLAEPVLRAEFEADLKRVCTGERNPKDVLREQIQKYKETYQIITTRVQAMDEQVGRRLNETPQQNTANDDLPIVRLEEVQPCPKCSTASMILRQKKDSTSSFLSCARYPDCRNAVWFPDEIKSVKLTEDTCNKCGSAYRIVELKFKQLNYLALLNAAGPTYKTCIACDSKFRNMFGINADCVKRLGAIVSDQNSVRTTTANNSNARSINEVLGRNTGNAAANSNRTNNSARTRTTTTNNPRGGNAAGTAPGRRNNSGPPNSRSNSTATNQNSAPAIEPIITNTTPIDDHLAGLDNAFDDAFDDVFLDLDVNTSSGGTTNQGSVTWGDTVRNSSDPSSSVSTHRNHDEENENAVRCGACGKVAKSLIVRKEGPNTGRSFYVCHDGCSFFQWGDEPNDTSKIQSNSNRGRTRNESDNTSNNRGGWSNDRPDNSSNNRDRSNTQSDSSGNSRGGWFSDQQDNTSNNRAGSNPQHNNTSNNRGWFNDQQNDTSNNRSWSTPQPDNTSNNRGGWFNDQHPNNNNNSSRANPQTGNAPKNRWANVQPDSNRWANVQPDNVQSSDGPSDLRRILCACNNPANERTVRKEGPNKGRQFYVCSGQETTCNFFKWVDENTQPNVGSASGQPRGSNAGTSSWGSANSNSNNRDRQPTTSRGTSSSNTGAASKRRKCGLCREEGHTKLKCPRKDEFGY